MEKSFNYKKFYFLLSGHKGLLRGGRFTDEKLMFYLCPTVLKSSGFLRFLDFPFLLELIMIHWFSCKWIPIDCLTFKNGQTFPIYLFYCFWISAFLKIYFQIFFFFLLLLSLLSYVKATDEPFLVYSIPNSNLLGNIYLKIYAT